MRNEKVKTYCRTETNTFLEIIGTSDSIVINEYKNKFSLIKVYLGLIKFLLFHKQKQTSDINSKIAFSIQVLKNYYEEEEFAYIEKDINKQFKGEVQSPIYFG